MPSDMASQFLADTQICKDVSKDLVSAVADNIENVYASSSDQDMPCHKSWCLGMHLK